LAHPASASISKPPTTLSLTSLPEP
jgi:hypothetical protein